MTTHFLTKKSCEFFHCFGRHPVIVGEPQADFEICYAVFSPLQDGNENV